jgi:hypothetical protein
LALGQSVALLPMEALQRTSVALATSLTSSWSPAAGQGGTDASVQNTWIRKELVALNVAPDPVVSVLDSADDAVV